MSAWLEKKVKEEREQRGETWLQSKIKQAQEREQQDADLLAAAEERRVRSEEQARLDAIQEVSNLKRMTREENYNRALDVQKQGSDSVPSYMKRLVREENYNRGLDRKKQEKYAPAVDFEDEEILALINSDTEALRQELEAAKAENVKSGKNDMSSNEAKTLQRELDEVERLQYLYDLENLRDAKDFGTLSQAKEIEKTGNYSLRPSADIDTLYQFINDTGDYDRETVKAMSFGTGQAQTYGGYEEYVNLRSDEKRMYNYLYTTEGKESAEKYLEALKPALEERRYAAHQEYLEDLSDKYPILTSVASVPASVLGGAVSGADLALRYVTGNNINPYNYAQQAGSAAQTIRGSVSEDFSDFGKFLYNTAMSGADSVAASVFGPMGGGVVLGVGAGADNAKDIMQRGGTVDQAILGGLAAGTFEMLFERWSLGNLAALKEIPSTSLKQAVKNTAKSMFVNASEEALTEATNIAFDALTMGDISNWQASINYYMSHGMTEDEATKQVWLDSIGQVGEAAAAGALMGGAFSAAGSIASNNESRRIGMEVNAKEGAADALMEAALQMAEDTETQHKAQMMKASSYVSNADVGNLYRSAIRDTANTYTDENLSKEEKYQRAQRDIDDLVFRNAAQVAQNKKPVAQKAAVPVEQATVAKNATPTQASENIVQQTAPAVTEETKVAESSVAAPAVYNDQAVDVKGVSSVENSTVYVKLADGGVVKAEEVEFDDPNVQELYEKAQNFATDTAKTFVAYYDGSVDVRSYTQGFMAIQGQARNGETFDGAVANAGVYAQKLTPAMQQAAFYAGQNAGKLTDTTVSASAVAAKTEKPAPETASQAEDTETDVVEYTPAKGKKGGVKRVGTKKLTASQQNQINALDVVFKAFGRTVEIVDSIDVKVGNEVRKSAANAMFDPNTNTYRIALDGVGEAYTYFAVHESIHDIKANNPEGYDKLKDVVVQYLKVNGEDVDALVHAQQELGNLSEAAALEEVVANSVPAILTDPETGNLFAQRFLLADEDARNVFQKLLDSILNFLQKAHDVLVGSERSWQQMEALEADIEAITSIREAYFDALEGLDDVQDTNKTGKTKLSPRIGVMADGRPVYTSNFPEGITRRERQDRILQLIQDVWSKNTIKLEVDRNGRTEVIEARFDPKFDPTGKEYSDASKLAYGNRKGTMSDQKVTEKLADDFPEIISNTKNVGNKDETGKSNPAHKDVAVWHYFAGGIVFVNEKGEFADYNVSVDVKETTQGDDYVYSVAAEKIKGSERMSEPNFRSDPKTILASGNGISAAITPVLIVQNHSDSVKRSLKDSNGNTLTEQQAEYFKDSKVVDEQGRLKIMYRGDDSEFTVFDRKKSRYSNLYGRGFYFTDSETHARQYGGAREFYLNIKNPLPTDETTITRSQMRKFLKAIAENEDDFSFENYGYGATVDSVLKSVYGKSDFAMLYDVNQTAVGDMVAAVELFNDVNGTNFDGLILDTETVAFYSNQAKSTDNLNPTEDSDIRFSMKEPVEETRDLIALHNLNEQKLLDSLALGGLPMPSIAIVRADAGHAKYGDISLVFGKDTIDPQLFRTNKVYGGDAWTPTFPRVEYKVNEKYLEKVEKKINDLVGGNDVRRQISPHLMLDADNVTDMLNRNDGDIAQSFDYNYALKYAYLKEINPEYAPPSTSEDLGKNSGHADGVITAIADAFGYDTVREMRTNAYTRFKEDAEAVGKMLGIINGYYRENVPGFANDMFKDMKFADYDRLVMDAYAYLKNGRKQVVDTVTLREDIDQMVDQKAYEKWLSGLFEGIVEKKGIRNEKDMFTPQGNRRSFDALHYEITLENVVKTMRKDMQKGGNGFFGGVGIWGVATKDYKSVEQMKADSNRLVSMPEEEYAAIRSEYTQRLGDLTAEIQDPTAHNSFIAMDNAAEALVDTLRTKRTVAAIDKELRSYPQLRIQSDTAEKALALLKDIANMPVDYFEAKPQRAVGFDEVLAAVVPAETTSQKLKDALTAKGVNVLDYSAGNMSDRLEKINSVKDARFSLKDVTPVDVKALEKQNAQLQAVNKTLREQLELTKGRRVSDADTKKIARKVLADYSSKYSADNLTESLGEIFKYLETNPNPNIDDIMDMGVGLAKAVLEQSSELNTEMQEYYADARSYLRNTGITLTDVQKEEAAAQYDSYNNYRKQLFGSVKLVKNGLSLDEAWQELSARYPGLFDADAAEGDMPALLDMAVQTMKPTYENPYGYNMDEAAFDLFLGMVDSYYEAPKIKTFADKKAEQIAALRQKLREDRAAFRKASKEKYDAKVLELKALQALKRQELSQEYRRLLAEGKEKHREKIAELKEAYKKASTDKVLKERARYQKMFETQMAKHKDTEERQKYRDRIEKTAKTLAEWLARPTDQKHVPEVLRKSVSDFLQTIEFGRSQKDSQKAAEWREKLKDLRDQMAAIDAGADAYKDFYADIDPDLVPRINTLVAANQNTGSIGDMSAAQLKELAKILDTVKHQITAANRLLVNTRYASLANLGDATMSELVGRKNKKARGRLVGGVDALLNVHQLDSFAYFDQLGSAAKTVLGGLRAGLDAKTVRVKQAMDYMEGALKGVDKKALNAMTGKHAKLHTFKTEANQTIQLTTAQVMELYLLNQRPQARGHIYGGGIRPTNIEVKDGRKTVRINNTAPVKVTENDVANIIKVLTPKQIALADQMQSFVGSKVAEWGNEVSMTMYGYKKFTEANYWPIRSDSNYTRTNDSDSTRNNGGGDLYKLKNLGMTKATIQGANNPMTLGDVFDTFVRHVDDMSSYNAFVAPLSDAMKWFNYVDKESGMGSVKQSIERVLGEEGQNYFVNLVRDINGSNNAGVKIGLIDMLMRNAKTAAVGANARVVLQQPTAYVRAAAEISPKYLARAATGFFSKANAEKAKKYSPIAQWKSWGFFDLNVGRSLRELIIGDQTTSQYLKEKSLAPAGWMDERTWGTLWKACELEVRHDNPKLKGEDFNVAVGKRLSEIIDRTQVVDSVLHRSQLMRSKNGLYALYTSFMSEPTKTYNMLRTALADMKRNNNARTRGRFGRVAVSFVATSVATAAAAAIADAFREEDDEKAFLEKWLGSFGANVGDNLNPLGMIPVAKEFVSLMNGYSVSRIDLQGAERVFDFGAEVIRMFEGKSTWNVQKLLYEGAKALSSVTGIPAGNAMRTLVSVYNTAFGDITWQNETATAKATYETMNRALTDGNIDKYSRLYQKMVDEKVAGYKTEEAKRKAAGETLKYADEASMIAAAKAAVDSSMADLLMADPAIEKAYEHRTAGRASALNGVYKELQAKGYNFNTITKAINKYENLVTAEPAENEYDLMKQYDAENLVAATRAAFTSGNTRDAQIIYDSMYEQSKAEDPAKSLKSTASENFRLEYIDMVEKGNAGKVERMADVLIDVFGYDQSDLDDWVKEWRGKQMNDAIAKGDASTANNWIKKMQADGRDYSSIRSSIVNKYKPMIVEAYENGDMTTYNMLVDTLLAIDLYTEKGKKAFTADTISDWLEAEDE